MNHVYNVDLEIDSFSLLKIHEEQNTDDILTIAFWSIYKNDSSEERNWQR